MNDQTAPMPRRRWVVPAWLPVLLVLLAVAEWSLRQPAVHARIPDPEPGLWPAPLAAEKLALLTAFEAARGIDVLFIGNSSVQAAVDPARFDAMRGVAVPGRGSFNAALEGVPPVGMERFLAMYLQRSHPQAIVYGLQPQDLNSNSPWARDVSERVRHAPRLIAAQATWRGAAMRALLDHSELFRHRGVMQQWLLRGGLLPPPGPVYVDGRGFHSIARRLADDAVARNNRAGVLNYSTEGEQLAALRRLIDHCRRDGLRVVLVNMPLTAEYLTLFDAPADYERYLTAVRLLSFEYDVPFWDPSRPPAPTEFTAADFADSNHLNRRGAAVLSTYLARRYLDLSGASPTSDVP